VNGVHRRTGLADPGQLEDREVGDRREQHRPARAHHERGEDPDRESSDEQQERVVRCLGAARHDDRHHAAAIRGESERQVESRGPARPDARGDFRDDR
jgi:hypothetical protein